MTKPDLSELCIALTQAWRFPAQRCDPDVRLVDVPGGWLRYRPGVPAGEFASTAETKLTWMNLAESAAAGAVGSAERTARECGCERAFVWVSPLAQTAVLEAALRERGATRVPDVRYFVLARASTPEIAAKPTVCAARKLSPDEASRVLDEVRPWFMPKGVEAGKRRAASGIAEFHAAFVGEKPIAIGAVFPLGAWAYLGWAGTDPEFRRRGAQTALIRSRVASAAAHGANWCLAETNTAMETSLHNLQRCGFAIAMEWGVYQWDLK